MPQGMYALVDIGAWTTDISVFRLAQEPDFVIDTILRLHRRLILAKLSIGGIP